VGVRDAASNRHRYSGVAAERFRSGFERRRGQLAVLGRRGSQVLLLAGLTGVLTGLAVTGFEWVTRDQLFEGLRDQPIGVQIAAPLVGLMLAQAILRWIARTTSPATADEYIHNFHEMGRRLDLRPLPGRILASMATLGFGGALGYEGPSIYLGAGIGSALQARFSRLFSRSDVKVLLVAGAAAGVAAEQARILGLAQPDHAAEPLARPERAAIVVDQKSGQRPVRGANTR